MPWGRGKNAVRHFQPAMVPCLSQSSRRFATFLSKKPIFTMPSGPIHSFAVTLLPAGLLGGPWQRKDKIRRSALTPPASSTPATACPTTGVTNCSKPIKPLPLGRFDQQTLPFRRLPVHHRRRGRHGKKLLGRIQQTTDPLLFRAGFGPENHSAPLPISPV